MRTLFPGFNLIKCKGVSLNQKNAFRTVDATKRRGISILNRFLPPYHGRSFIDRADDILFFCFRWHVPRLKGNKPPHVCKHGAQH